MRNPAHWRCLRTDTLTPRYSELPEYRQRRMVSFFQFDVAVTGMLAWKMLLALTVYYGDFQLSFVLKVLLMLHCWRKCQ